MNKIEKLSKYLREFHKIFHSAAAFAAKEANLSMAQYRLLRELEAKQTLSVKEIKESLRITQSAASELAERMMKAGYIKKIESESDKRVTLYKATNKANKKLSSLNKKFQRIADEIFSELNDSEMEKLIDAFEIIISILKRNKKEK